MSVGHCYVPGNEGLRVQAGHGIQHGWKERAVVVRATGATAPLDKGKGTEIAAISTETRLFVLPGSSESR